MNKEQDIELSPACPGQRRCRRHAGCDGTGPRCAPDGSDGVGVALRSLREARHLSIKALAEQSGLAVNTLSLIENGKTSPSVSTLQQLAITLDIPITAFFASHPTVRQVVYTQAGQRPYITFDQGSLEDLGLGLTSCPVEPFLVTLAADASSSSHAVAHTGYEFVLCLTGRIAYFIQQQIYHLQPADSLFFEAALPHRWQNVHSSESQMLVMFCPTRNQSRPVNPHFSL